LYGGTPNFIKALRQIVAGTINHRKEKMSNKPQATSVKPQATSDPRLSPQAIKIHEAWCMENGYLKPEAPKVLRRFSEASSVKHQAPRYKSSDYQRRATIMSRVNLSQ
jgi:hypothetical protein